MSKATITIMTCDRCGVKEEIRRPEQGYAWGRINFAQVNGHIWVGSPMHKTPDFADMCQSCMQAADGFWKRGPIREGKG